MELYVSSEDVLRFLEDTIFVEIEKLAMWEEFDGQEFQLADVRTMQPLDAFLYGIATGRKHMAEELLSYVEEQITELNHAG